MIGPSNLLEWRFTVCEYEMGGGRYKLVCVNVRWDHGRDTWGSEVRWYSLCARARGNFSLLLLLLLLLLRFLVKSPHAKDEGERREIRKTWIVRVVRVRVLRVLNTEGKPSRTIKKGGGNGQTQLLRPRKRYWISQFLFRKCNVISWNETLFLHLVHLNQFTYERLLAMRNHVFQANDC